MLRICVLLAKVLALVVGFGLVLMSTLLYESEEGALQSRLEQWWVALSDTEPRAVGRHAAFVAGVASAGGRILDKLFGDRLFSVRAVGVSACLSLAAVGVVCSPGLSGIISELPRGPYAVVVTLLIVMGVLPASLGPRLPEKLWISCVVVLSILVFMGMNTVNWFNLDIYKISISSGQLELSERPYYLSLASYYLFFVLSTITCDVVFIAVTRWLLRITSRLHSNGIIIGLMAGNVFLACLLVILPVSAAWGFSAVWNILGHGRMIETANEYALFSNTVESFLATLAASNLLDGFVACTFFLVLLVFLLHRLIWPIVQRPAYALATCGVVRRRKLFFTIGVFLVGLGGLPKPVTDRLVKILGSAFDH